MSQFSVEACCPSLGAFGREAKRRSREKVPFVCLTKTDAKLKKTLGTSFPLKHGARTGPGVAKSRGSLSSLLDLHPQPALHRLHLRRQVRQIEGSGRANPKNPRGCPGKKCAECPWAGLFLQLVPPWCGYKGNQRQNLHLGVP